MRMAQNVERKPQKKAECAPLREMFRKGVGNARGGIVLRPSYESKLQF